MICCYLNISSNSLVCEELSGDDLDGDSARHDSIHGALSEGIKHSVAAAHQVRLEKVPSLAVVLEYAQVELHWNVKLLIVEGHQLTTRVPECLRIIVETVDPGSFGIYPGHLQVVVFDKAKRI